MKIGIFETEHFEGAYPVIKLFDKKNNTIAVFVYELSYRQFEHLFDIPSAGYTWIVKDQKQSKYIFIYRIYRETKKRQLDFLYLNTISNNFIVYALMILLLPKVRVVMTMHNINEYFDSAYRLSLRRIVRNLGKKILISVVKEFNVVSLTMVNYLQSRLPAGKIVHCIPGAIFEERKCLQKQPAIKEQFNIVITGSIDRKRRNYDHVFALLDEVKKNKLPVAITLLGGFYGEYGKQILAVCREWNKNNRAINYYEKSIVDQPEFDRVMNEATFVFLPSVIDTSIADEVAETYGVSISSGNLFDIIKHAKPFIIPAALKVDPFLEKSCFRYTAITEVAVFLQEVYERPELYEDLQALALDASRNYTIEKIRDRNPDIFCQSL